MKPRTKALGVFAPILLVGLSVIFASCGSTDDSEELAAAVATLTERVGQLTERVGQEDVQPPATAIQPTSTIPLTVSQALTTPTSEQSGFQILSSFDEVDDSLGYLTIEGELQNNTNTACESRQVEIIVEFRAANGTFRGSDYGFIDRDVQPGQRMTFDIIILDPPDFDYYDLVVDDGRCSGLP